MKEKKGISLIVLIVTIIVMIIIAGAIIISLSDTNIIDQAGKATTNWNISTIKEQINVTNAIRSSGIEGNFLEKVKNGTLEEVGIEDEEWNKKLIIQNEKLVYRPENVTEKEAEEFISNGIIAGDYIAVVNTSDSLSNYQNTSNIIVASELNQKLKDDKNATVFILEDISLSGWTTVSYPDEDGDGIIEDFKGTIDGCGNTISDLNVTLIQSNEGIIKNITLTGQCDYLYAGMFTEYNYGTIMNCHNKVDILDGIFAAGITYSNYDSGKIINCSNTGNIYASDDVAGIAIINTGNIYNTFNSGNIEGYESSSIRFIGGIVANNYTGNVENCYNSGNINIDVSGYEFVCGIIGAYGNLKCSYNIGNIDASGILDTNVGKIGYNIETLNVFAANKNTAPELGKSIVATWIEDLVETDGDTVTLADKTELLNRLNAGNSTKVWVEDTNNINNGYPILYWQVQ